MSNAKKIVLLVGAAAAAAALYYGLNWWEAHRSVPPTVAWGTVDTVSYTHLTLPTIA